MADQHESPQIQLILGLIVYFTYGQKHSRVQRSLLPKDPSD